jgi:hypothetical protein
VKEFTPQESNANDLATKSLVSTLLLGQNAANFINGDIDLRETLREFDALLNENRPSRAARRCSRSGQRRGGMLAWITRGVTEIMPGRKIQIKCNMIGFAFELAGINLAVRLINTN